MRRPLSLVVGLVALCPFAVLAQQPAAPKSDYSLFNPTPADQMRSFSTDRPTKSNVPYTVDAGHFQVEGDAIFATYDHWSPGGTTQRAYVYGDPTLKLGLTDRTEFGLTFVPYTSIHTTNRATGVKSQVSGFGDVVTRLKINAWGNEGDKSTAFALIPFVKWPTAARGVSNNQIEGGLIAPLSISLPYDFTLIYAPEVDVQKNAADNGRHAAIVNLVNLSRPVLPDVTAYAELWSNANLDTKGRTQYTADFAVSWVFATNAQVDVGMNIGLNKVAPDFQPYLGLSWRY